MPRDAGSMAESGASGNHMLWLSSTTQHLAQTTTWFLKPGVPSNGDKPSAGSLQLANLWRASSLNTLMPWAYPPSLFATTTRLSKCSLPVLVSRAPSRYLHAASPYIEANLSSTSFATSRPLGGFHQLGVGRQKIVIGEQFCSEGQGGASCISGTRD